jgi:hypothetical protein
MNTVIVVVLWVLGATILIGAIVAFFGLRKAPDGFEDQEGFHPSNKRKP